MFVHPEQVSEVLKRHPAITRARLVVDAPDGLDRPVLRFEGPADSESLAAAIGKTFQTVCKVRAEIEPVLPGTLPNDGKLIEDTRKIGR
jgi:phenylacetate-CoA ligase